jgi:acyl carrier protein
MNLDALTGDLDLDFFVLFSAGAAWLGAPGQGNYAAANAAQDALAHSRRAAGRPAMSIAWGRWAGGLGSDGRSAAEWQALGLGAIPVAQGVDAMFDLLERDPVDVAVLPVEWPRYLAKAYAGSVPRFFAVAPRASLVARLEATAPAQRRELLRRQLDGIVRRVVGVATDRGIDPRLPLQELGIDSLMTVELRNAISRAVDRPLPATLVFDHPTLEALSAHLLGAVLGLDVGATSAETATPDALHEVQALSEQEAEALLLRELTGGAGT